MKLIYSIILLMLLFLVSCKDTWDESDKDSFRRTCMQDARQWAGSEELATTYCNCVMEKILLKYPHENDALENLDSIVSDPNVKACRQLIIK